jgi:hypothetical protein
MKEILNSDHYAVTENGEVYRLPFTRKHNINKGTYNSKLKQLSPSTNNTKGYARVAIHYLDGTKVMESVHRLVAKCFVPNPDNKPQVNHIDGNKLNNHFSNLEWVTNEENAEHAARFIRFDRTKTTKQKMKLTAENVFEIKAKLDSGKSTKEVAEEYGVSRSLIGEIIAGRA